MSVAIIGAKGMLGSELVSAFTGRNLFVTRLDLPSFDITNVPVVARELTRLRPAVVVNAAAYTNVDGCEREQEKALAVNGTAVGTLAEACRRIGSRLVHFSTDYVFDGDNQEGYAEDAIPRPLSTYGRSKLFGEHKLLASGCAHVLIRTSWLFGAGRADNVVEKIISRAKRDGTLKLVNDRWGKPTYAKDLAAATLGILVDDKPDGIYHLTNDTPKTGITWYEFGLAIVDLLKLKIPVTPCLSTEFPQVAVRPVRSLLVNTKLPSLRPWREALKEYIMKRKT